MKKMWFGLLLGVLSLAAAPLMAKMEQGSGSVTYGAWFNPGMITVSGKGSAEIIGLGGVVSVIDADEVALLDEEANAQVSVTGTGVVEHQDDGYVTFRGYDTVHVMDDNARLTIKAESAQATAMLAGIGRIKLDGTGWYQAQYFSPILGKVTPVAKESPICSFPGRGQVVEVPKSLGPQPQAIEKPAEKEQNTDAVEKEKTEENGNTDAVQQQNPANPGLNPIPRVG